MGERKRIGQRDIKALSPSQVVWDSAVIGFGARRQRSEAVSYFVFYRTAGGRQRWQTIGRHGAPWTPDTARDEARRLLGDVARGEDPAGAKAAIRKAITLVELCDRYMVDAKAGLVLTRFGSGKKASTLAIDEGRIARHIKPLLGGLAVAAVTAADIRNLRDAVAAGKTACDVKTSCRGLARVRGGKGAATRALRLLGGIFTYAIAHGMRADNPVRGVPQFRDGQRERRLSESEYRAFGKALRQANKSAWPPAVAAARFLALTGWRSGEVLNLKWSEVDLYARTAVLPGTKTGRSMRPLSGAACDVLRELPRIGGLVFPSSRSGGLMPKLAKHWTGIIKHSGLSADITPHVLRHGFASVAADLGYSDLTIAALLGHRARTITSRYARTADPVLLAAADATSNRIRESMRVRRGEQ
jgi:integrase